MVTRVPNLTPRIPQDHWQQYPASEVVLVHDDTPRINRQLAVIEDVVKGLDRLIRAANMHTKAERMNRPIAQLYCILWKFTLQNL